MQKMLTGRLAREPDDLQFLRVVFVVDAAALVLADAVVVLPYFCWLNVSINVS